MKTMKLQSIAFRAVAVVATLACLHAHVCRAADDELDDVRIKRTVSQGLEWLAASQSRGGSWTANNSSYPTAMTAMAGVALSCEGSTATQGKYQENIRRAVDYLISRARPNGLIGDPEQDDRYTYGHGFSLLFLSQVLGEEEDDFRRQRLVEVLNRGVEFTGRAQTSKGGWGYVSAKDGSDFDEGSTTVTQVQGLRGCRNAGIKVPKEIIDRAVKYIHSCSNEDGGIQYSTQGGGSRPAITAASIACLFNAGEYDDKFVPKMMAYCKEHLPQIGGDDFGHWHYAHYYYAQVMYREGDKSWKEYRQGVYKRILAEAKQRGELTYWDQGYIGPVFTTSVNLLILQLDTAALPIYQR
jgi:hypothetical protein